MKTPTGYVALRKGRHVWNCIFLNWYDAEIHIIDYDEAEYTVLDTFQDAEKYIINNFNNNSNSSNTNTNANSTRRLEEFATVATTTAALKNMNTNDTNDTTIIAPAQLPPLATATIDTKIEDASPASPDPNAEDDDDGDEHRRPKKRTKLNNNNQPTNSIQNNNERGSSNNNNDNKSITTQDDSISQSHNDNNKDKNNDEIIEKNQSTTKSKDISVSPSTDAAATKNCRSSKRSASTTTSTKYKLDKWNDEFEKMFEQLKEYYKKYGVWYVMKQHQKEYMNLFNWIHKVCKEYKKKYLNPDTASRLSTQQVTQLTEVGILTNPDDNNSKTASQQHNLQLWNDEFEKMIVQLKEYKEKYGSAYVTKKHQKEYHDLHKWCAKIRTEYRKLSDDENGKCSSRLSIQQIAQLNEIGLQLKMKIKKYKTFNEWIVELQEYAKQNGGDISNIPNKHPKFGKFISNQRMDYHRMCQGKSSPMNEEKFKILDNLGIKWNENIWKDDVLLSWDDRYKQLVDYKKLHGHVLVPKRTTGGLGYWVRDQRKHYKLMLHGKKNRMTPDKVSKLMNIGFVFDASEYKFKQIPNNNIIRKDDNNDDDDYEEDYNIESD